MKPHSSFYSKVAILTFKQSCISLHPLKQIFQTSGQEREGRWGQKTGQKAKVYDCSCRSKIAQEGKIELFDHEM